MSTFHTLYLWLWFKANLETTKCQSPSWLALPSASPAMSASVSTLAEFSDWDLLESGATDWELLSNLRWAPTEDDSISIATDGTDLSRDTLCTRLGWPGLGTVGQPVPESRSFLDALLQGGGGLDGEKAIEMSKGPQSLIHFVNGYRRNRKESLPVIEEEMDADQDWWLRKGQGSLLAKRRWKYDRRPVFCNAERRQGFGRQQPTWEYESGQSAEGYCLPEEEF